MPTLTLTDISLRALKPVPGKQVTYVDKSLRGFGVRVTETGAMSYVLTYGPERRRIKLGDVGIVALKDARSKARNVLAQHQLGIAQAEDAPTFTEAKDLFLAACDQKNKPRTVKDYKRLLSRHFNFGSRRLSEITTQEVNRRVDRIQKTISEQNHAIVAAKIFFRWAQRRQYIKHSPCEGMGTVKRQPRARVLSPKELVAIYKTAEKYDTPFTRIVRVCILTGLRRSEAAWLRRSYVTERFLTLPSSLTKNKREFVTPLGTMAQGLLTGIVANDYLFPAERGDKVFGGWSKQKAIFDKQLATEGHFLPAWVLHDIRRGYASLHGEIGTPIHVTERLLNHVSGTFGGIVGVYQKHTWLPEMRMAIANWEAHFRTLISGSYTRT